MASRKVNLSTYQAILSLQVSIPAHLDRCWTQEPAILEDALGRVSNIHLGFLESWLVRNLMHAEVILRDHS